MIDVSVAADQQRALISFTPGDRHLDAVVRSASRRIDEVLTDGVQQITWHAQVGDERSRRVAWACGFTFEATLRGYWVAQHSLTDAWVGTLLAGDSREPKTRWLEAVTLSAPGIVLREESVLDKGRYVQTMQDAESLQWLGTLTLPKTEEEFDAMFARRCTGPSLGSSLTWTVADPAADRYLASVSLFGIGGIDYKSAEVGYRTHPDSRRSGVLTAALRLVVQHAFTAESAGGVGLERLSLGAGDTNVGSQAVARACGFVQTGRDRRCYDLYDGTVVDLIRFDLLRSEVVG